MNEYICMQPDEIIELHDTGWDQQDVYINSPASPSLLRDDATLNISTVKFHKVPVYFRKWVETSQGMNGNSFGYWVKIRTHKWETDEMMGEDENYSQLQRENRELRDKIGWMLSRVDPYNMAPEDPNIHKGKSHEDKKWEELFTIEWN